MNPVPTAALTSTGLTATGLIAFQVISFSASVGSLILAVLAIWLSVEFFKMSSEASKATTEAAKGIAASVERLEKFFDKLYADSFSMVRETVSDLRKHAWPIEDSDTVADEVEKKAEDKMAELNKGIDAQLKEVLGRQEKAELDTTSLRREMRELVASAIRTTRQVDEEAREETTREHILHSITNSRGLRAMDLSRRLNLKPKQLVEELRKLREDGDIELINEDENAQGGLVLPSTIVRSLPRQIGKKLPPRTPEDESSGPKK